MQTNNTYPSIYNNDVNVDSNTPQPVLSLNLGSQFPKCEWSYARYRVTWCKKWVNTGIRTRVPDGPR